MGPAKIAEGGVVRDAAARAEAIDDIRKFVADAGLLEPGWVDSTVPGPAGNDEALLVARKP